MAVLSRVFQHQLNRPLGWKTKMRGKNVTLKNVKAFEETENFIKTKMNAGREQKLN